MIFKKTDKRTFPEDFLFSDACYVVEIADTISWRLSHWVIEPV